MAKLTREQILEAVKCVRGGTITRVTYCTDVPIKAEFKKQGYRIKKIVDTSARIGVNYGHLPSVIEKNKDKVNEAPNNNSSNYEWVIKDRVRHNTNTNKDYVALISFNKGHNTRTKYIIEVPSVGNIDMGGEIDSHYRHIVLESYFKKSYGDTEFKNVAFDNIIKINNVGDTLVF